MATYTPNFNLSKPEDTDTQSSFITDYRSNMDTIDANLGGGGGGNVYGVYIDPSHIITSGSWNNSLSYTATEDCFILIDGDLQNSHLIVNIDGVKIYDLGSSTYIQQVQLYPLRKGQVLTATKTTNYDLTYTVFGVLEGSDGIFAPVIYSDTERMIGVWRDNKPLYARTFDIGSTTVSYNSWTVSSIPKGDMETITHASAVNQNGKAFWGDVMTSLEVDSTYVALQCGRNGANEIMRYVTLYYTKTTDSAGSGDWNTDGIPMHHYSTNEQVIGTWIDGKPIYERTWDFSGSPIMLSYANWVDSGISASENIQSIISAELKYGVVTNMAVEVAVGADGYPVAFQKVENTGNTRGVEYCTLRYTKSTD